MSETLTETGLVTATVNPVAATTMPNGWTIHKVAALVRDLAMNLYDTPTILKTHNLSEAQHVLLTENEFFKRALEAAVIEWNSPQSTNKRLAMEAAIALEDALPAVAARLSKANEPLPGVVELAKLLAKMAGVGESATQPIASEKFKITINLGSDVLSLEKERAPRNLVEVQSFPEGEGANAPVQRLLGAPRNGPAV